MVRDGAVACPGQPCGVAYVRVVVPPCRGHAADQLACLRSLSVTALLDSNLTRVPIIGMSLAQAAVKSFYTGLGLDDDSVRPPALLRAGVLGWQR